MDVLDSFRDLDIDSHLSSFCTEEQQQQQPPSHYPNSAEPKLKERTQVLAAFESSETTDEVLKAFQDMESDSSFDEYDLGLACCRVASMLNSEGKDPEKTLSFAIRAWKALDKDDKSTFPVAMALKLMGSATYRLNRFSHSLNFLNMANSVLERIEKNGFTESSLGPLHDELQRELAMTKRAMGKRHEALGDLRKCLGIKERNMRVAECDVGNANYDLADAYVAALRYKEALPFCLKALKTHKNQLAHNSKVLLRDMRLLGNIYSGLGQQHKAEKALKKLGLSSDYLCEEIDGVEMQVALGNASPNAANIEKLKPLVNELPKILSRSQILEAFESAKSLDEMLTVFQIMESTFDEYDLGLASLRVSRMFYLGKDPEMTLSFANRALNAFDIDEQPTSQIALALTLMGSATCTLKRFDDSLGYLDRANSVLRRIEEKGLSGDCTRPTLHLVQRELANVKMATGRTNEAFEHLRKCLEIKEMDLEKTSQDFGDMNWVLADACAEVLNYKVALTCCLKALEIHKKQLRHNSDKILRDRWLLAFIYTELLEYQKALVENELLQRDLQDLGLSSQLLRTQIAAADLQNLLGRFDEALDILNRVVQKTDNDSEIQVQVSISLANVLFNQRKFVAAKRYLKSAIGILDDEKIEKTVEVAEAYQKTAKLYETMKEYETAISLLNRAFTILEKNPQVQHVQAQISARLGKLLLLIDKAPQATSCLESAAERMKECFGPLHIKVGFVYKCLGGAYLKLERFHSAAQMFALAKRIMDASLGPHHADSIEACQDLSKAYGAMGSYGLAVQFQQQVVDAYEGLGTKSKSEVREARRLLKQLNKKAIGSCSGSS